MIIDVRIDADFADDLRYIPSAVRHPFTDSQGLAARCQGKRVIIYCQKGLKISQGVAALLRVADIKAETLEGGQFAWHDAGLPLVPADRIPPRTPQRWVCHRPKIDRIACPWLIRRLIDPNAEFLFVAPAQVENVAEKFAATPLDIDGAFWGHRGEYCTFDTMLDEFALRDDALDRLSVIVRGADTNRLDLAPQSAGLMAASLGLSRMV